MNLKIPKLSLVVLIGPSGSGKSTFARRHFRPTEVLSSDACRGMVSRRRERPGRHEGRLRGAPLHRRQAAGPGAADGHRRHQRPARGPQAAGRAGPAVPLPAGGDRARPARAGLPGAEPATGPTGTSARTSSATRSSQLRRSLRGLRKEGFRHVFVLDDPRGGRGGDRRAGAALERPDGTSTGRSTSSATSTAAATSLRNCSGGSATSRPRLGGRRSRLGQPGLRPSRGPQGGLRRRPGGPWPPHPRHGAAGAEHGRPRLGPLRPRQPRHEARSGSSGARTSRSPTAWPTRWPRSTPCPARCGHPFCKELADFLDGLVSHYVLDDGKLVVAHAGMKEEMQGRGSGKVRDFALYGETTGETDEFGLPVRYDWAKEYRGQAMVVYGHTPVPEPEWLNRTVNIDTGCVFGGKLTALRYPEKEFVSVPAARTYCEPARPVPARRAAGPGPVGPAGPRRGARRRGRAGQADRPDPAAGQRHDPGGERRRGPGGDEPVRRRPEVADLPAAHHVALRDQRRAGPAGAPRRGVRLLPQPGCPAGRLRGEAHGLSGRRRRLPGRGGGDGSGSASTTGELGHRLHPHGPAVLQRPGPGTPVPRPGA